MDAESTELLIKTRALKMHLSKGIGGIKSDMWLHQRSGATINDSPSSTMQRHINDDTWLHQRCNDRAIYLDATMKIKRTVLIAKLARRGATRGDITTVRFKSDRRDETREGGPVSWDRGISYAHNHDHPTDLHQIRCMAFFTENFPLNPMFFSCFLNF